MEEDSAVGKWMGGYATDHMVKPSLVSGEHWGDHSFALDILGLKVFVTGGDN